MKMKSALVGLVLGGLSSMTIRDWPALASPSLETIIRQVTRASRYRPPSTVGCRPSSEPSVWPRPSGLVVVPVDWVTHKESEYVYYTESND